MAASDEDAPWLAEAAPLAPAPKRRPLLNILIIALAAGTVIAVALLMLLGRRDAGSSEGYMEAAQAPLIEADPGPFKVAPADRQGMEVEGMGEVIHGAVRGENIESQIDMSALPEEPMGRPRDLLPPGTGTAPPPATDPAAQQVPVQVLPPASPPAPARPAIAAPARPAPAASAPAASAPAKPAPATPAPATTRPAPLPARPAPLPAAPPVAAKPAAAPPTAAAAKGGTLVQIGAFSSEAKAEEEWARVSRKGGLSGKRIEKLTTSAGKTLWRVRGVAADPAAACTAIEAMGGACEAVKS